MWGARKWIEIGKVTIMMLLRNLYVCSLITAAPCPSPDANTPRRLRLQQYGQMVREPAPSS